MPTIMVGAFKPKMLRLADITEYYLLKPRRGEFIFGYANLPEPKIREGIQRLKKALKE